MLTGSGSLIPKLLTYPIDSRDTLVIAEMAARLGIARTVREKQGRVCPRTTILYWQIVWSNYSARGGAVSC
ncbi:MAG: hypothetical protein ABI180_02310 [Microcoleus sp.]|jgi:hypothetical protein